MPARKKKLLICEGAEDMALVRAFVSERLLADDFDLRYIGQKQSPDANETGYGISGLEADLDAIPLTGLLSGKTSLGILVDNDMEAPKGPVTRYVQNALTAANAGDAKNVYSPVTAAHAKATSRKIHTTLILMPGPSSEIGCLETLLVSVLKKLYADQMAAVEAYLTGAVEKWPDPAYTASKRDKARVRCALAILNRPRPQISLASLWDKAPNVIPVKDDLFKPLIAKLAAI